MGEPAGARAALAFAAILTVGVVLRVAVMHVAEPEWTELPWIEAAVGGHETLTAFTSFHPPLQKRLARAWVGGLSVAGVPPGVFPIRLLNVIHYMVAMAALWGLLGIYVRRARAPVMIYLALMPYNVYGDALIANYMSESAYVLLTILLYHRSGRPGDRHSGLLLVSAATAAAWNGYLGGAMAGLLVGAHLVRCLRSGRVSAATGLLALYLMGVFSVGLDAFRQFLSFPGHTAGGGGLGLPQTPGLVIDMVKAAFGVVWLPAAAGVLFAALMPAPPVGALAAVTAFLVAAGAFLLLFWSNYAVAFIALPTLAVIGWVRAGDRAARVLGAGPGGRPRPALAALSRLPAWLLVLPTVAFAWLVPPRDGDHFNGRNNASPARVASVGEAVPVCGTPLQCWIRSRFPLDLGTSRRMVRLATATLSPAQDGVFISSESMPDFRFLRSFLWDGATRFSDLEPTRVLVSSEGDEHTALCFGDPALGTRRCKVEQCTRESFRFVLRELGASEDVLAVVALNTDAGSSGANVDPCAPALFLLREGCDELGTYVVDREARQVTRLRCRGDALRRLAEESGPRGETPSAP